MENVKNVPDGKAVLHMPKDIAPDFRHLIRIIPESWLSDMRFRLISLEDSSKAIQQMIFEINVEFLRRKWSKDLG